jgi:tRNA-Thr(GGU) m(6)t(6)A37 methyltransferase TsaA
MGEDYQVKPIGVVEKAGQVSEIHIFQEYRQGLAAVEDYEKLMILFWMHLRDNPQDRSRLMTGRRRHGKNGYSGVFATHSPYRPNPIGVTVVDLVKVDEGWLYVKGFDAFEETPVLDIKSA